MKLNIYIIRHGQTDLNKKMALQGRSDNQLNDNGRAQAIEAGELFKAKGIVFDKVYTSPLGRAIETAKLVAGEDVETLVDERLLEMDYGPFEGMTFDEGPEELKFFFKDFVHNPAPEGMEQLASVVGRLGEFLEDIKDKEKGNILLSTHAIAMKGALEYLTPEENTYWYKNIGNCAVYFTEYENGEFTVPKEIEDGTM